MIKGAQSIKDKLKTISKEKNLEFNSVIRFFMYDRFVERLSKSRYRDNFILKGGFYLSILFGIDNRSTMDIDTAIRKVKFSEEIIVKMLEEIINIKLDDNVKFKIEKITSIREDDEYGGLRVTINFRLENISDRFHIDIVTGDSIYPSPENYKYESLISEDIYNVWTYNLETLLAEKIETILSRLEASSRMKDYYDIYLIYKFKFEKIDKNKFIKCVEQTFRMRKFNDNLINNLNIIKTSSILEDKWQSYSKKYNYANNLNFEEIIKCLEKFIEILIK